jgi:DNA-directed RNA polymerase subunit RPC12/RpoP
MIENNNQVHEAFIYHQRRRCPHCTAQSRLTHSLLDTRHGHTVHVYQCVACGKRIWDERPGRPTRLQ